MSVWIVRAGREGEAEDFALKNGIAVIGWGHAVGDLTNVHSREKLRELMQEHYQATRTGRQIGSRVGKIWAFRHDIEPGDFIVLPLKSRKGHPIAIGTCRGAYRYEPTNSEDTRHTRPVEWIREDIPRQAFEDLSASFDRQGTVYQINDDRVEERIRAILQETPQASVVPVDNNTENLQNAHVPQQIPGNLTLRRSTETKPRVFLAEFNPKYDVHDAERYGTLVHLLKAQMSPFDTTGMVEALRKALDDNCFDPERDFICMTGPSLVVAMLLGTITADWERVRLLMFDAKSHFYRDRWFNTESRDRDAGPARR